MDDKHLAPIETKIEHDLDKHSYKAAYKELDELRDHDKKHFKHDLKEINKQLHKDGYLPGLEIVENKNGGFDVKATGQDNPPKAPHHYNPPSGGYDAGGA